MNLAKNIHSSIHRSRIRYVHQNHNIKTVTNQIFDLCKEPYNRINNEDNKVVIHATFNVHLN